MTRCSDSLATALLVSRIAGDGHDTLKASEFWSLPESPGDLLGRSVDDLVADGFAPELAERLARLFDRSVALAFELDRYEESGIRTVTVHDDGYPQRLRERLGDRAPVLLHLAGDPGLLSDSSVGVVGSRGVDEAGAEVAASIARHAAGTGRGLVSGGARGVDQIAMNAAWEAGGHVGAILADSLTRTLRRPEVRTAVLDGTAVFATPYGPEAPFSVGNAMGRNKVVYALAAATVVVASDEDSGGTWAGATETLRHGFGRVVVWRGAGEGPGNAALVGRGAAELRAVEDLDAVLSEPDLPQPVAVPEPPVQDALFVD